MAKLLSPGVLVTETDLSQVVVNEAATTAVFGGNFEKGPVGFALDIDSVANLKEYYGYPNKYNYNDWYQCYNFLQYGNHLKVSRAANLNGDLKLTDLKYKTNKFTLAPNKEKLTITFYKQATVNVTFARTNVFSVGDKVSFAENPMIFEVKYVRDENIEITRMRENQVTTEHEDVTTVTFDLAPEITEQTQYFYKITEGVQPTGNLLSFTGKNTLQVGDIFGLTSEFTDPQFRVLEISTENVNGTFYTNVKYVGRDDTDALVSAVEGKPVYKLERTQSACVEIPSTYRVYNSVDYDKSEHTVPDFNVFSDLKVNLPFINDDAKLKFFAKFPGQDGNKIDIAIANVSDFNNGKEVIEGISLDSNFEFAPFGKQFAVVVIYKNEVKETYIVSLDENEKDDNNNSLYIENVINKKSSYVLVSVNEANPENTVASMLHNKIAKLSNGQDSTPGIDDIEAAYEIFDNKEEVDIDIVIANELSPKTALNLAIKRADCIAFVGCPKSASVGLKATLATAENIKFRTSLNANTSFGVLSSNYKYQYSNEMQKYIWVNLAGDIAGLRAQTSYNRDAWWASAGLERGQIKNAAKLAYSPTNAQRDLLYKNNINPVVNFPNLGILNWGQKTLLNKESSFNRVNVRSLFNVLERALAKMAKYSLFEFNDSFTRNYIVSLIKPFLAGVKAGRGIQDYLVICDETNNTPQVLANNMLVIDVYIKPTYVAEFIHLNFVNVGTNSFSIAISGGNA